MTRAFLPANDTIITSIIIKIRLLWDMLLDAICIVLCRPEEAGNVGAVCRVMKNMGLSKLRIVRGRKELSPELVLSRSVHAGELWEKAVFFDSLAGAVADRTIIIGTTRRRGKHRKQFPLSPAETARYLKNSPGRAALVFGNEQTGLTGEELEHCTLASYIPAAGAFPSLNLSHALQVYAYELFTQMAEQSHPEGGRWEPLERQALDTLVKSLGDSLAELGFYKQRGREEQARFFRDILSRAGITIKEGRYLDGIFKKAAKLGTREKRKQER
jgi:tRNA/rRNA methyltransferase/tRNA (cytidine32/uridine32-2'-O)-methyltransferase